MFAKKTIQTLNASLIISGTSIGGGILALPSATGDAGIFPSLVNHLVCWLYMLATGLLLAEACIWLKGKNHFLPSITEHFLGRRGKWFCCLLFIFLYYALLTSYISGMEPYVHFLLSQCLPLETVPPLVSMSLLSLLIGSILFVGSNIMSKVNLILMLGLFGSFTLLVFTSFNAINAANFMTESKWLPALQATPIFIGAYGYHNVIPSLSSSLNHDSKSLRHSLYLGTFIPFVIYCIWQIIALGIVAHVDLKHQFATAGIPIIESIAKASKSPYLTTISYSFSFFAIFTSILGVAYSMLDFLTDILKLPNSKNKRIISTILTFLPPIIIASTSKHLFLSAFSFASGFGEALLNGLIPIAIFWLGHYKLKKSTQYGFLANKALLLSLTAFTFLIMFLEYEHLLGR